MKKIFAAFLIALLSAAAAFAQDAPKVLRVGTDPDFPPFEYYQPTSGSYTGFEVELIEALAPLMGYTHGVSFVNVEFEEILTGLEEGRYDVAIAGFSVTPEREKIAAFSRPYLTAGFAAVARKAAGFSSAADAINGRRVAVERGSRAAALVRSTGEPAEVIETEGTEAALHAVENGEADCAFAARLACAFFIANGWSDSLRIVGEEDISPDRVALAVRRGDAELLAKLNEALSAFMRSSAYEQLYMTYFGTER